VAHRELRSLHAALFRRHLRSSAPLRASAALPLVRYHLPYVPLQILIHCFHLLARLPLWSH
jgi:hypothetical protein